VWIPLGVWGFIPSHSFALPGAWNVTPRLPSWPALLQALALATSPKLGLRHFVWFCFCCNWVVVTIKGVSWLAWLNDFVNFGFDFRVNFFWESNPNGSLIPQSLLCEKKPHLNVHVRKQGFNFVNFVLFMNHWRIWY
jgi:hypothetical protein